MKKYITLIGFVLLFSSSLVYSQQVLRISKADVLTKVTENNISLKISEQEYNQARADFRQTNAVLLPNISVSHTGMATTNPLMAFGSKLNQEILTQNDFNPALLNDPSQIENYATKFEVQQPLINVDGMFQRKAAKTKMQAMQLKTERTSDYLEFEVDKAYMQLQLAHKAVEVLEKALEAANANKKLADNSFEQGYLQRSDVLAVEVRVTEVMNQLQSAKSNVRNASNYLSFLMNENQYVVYKPSDSLTVATFELEYKTVSEERSDIKAMQLASDAYHNMHKADKMAFLPRLNAFGSYELYDDQVFQGDANGYIFGAQLSWNIFEGSAAFNNAQKDYNRFKSLFADNSASQKEMDDMTANYEMAKARLEAANQMKNEVNSQFAYANITAPFSGIVTNKFIEAGDMANPGMPLIAVEEPGKFEVTAMVPESEISQIKSGTTVDVLVKSLGESVKGKVTEVSTSAKNTGGQFLVKAVLDKTDAKILSGMFATVQFPVEKTTKSNMVLIPSEAIVNRGQLTGVYTVSQSNTALLRWLRLGRTYGDQVEVLSGLNADESYIVSAESKLYNGVKISIQ